MRSIKLAALASTVILTASADAALDLYEPFDYTPGNLVVTSGGTWSGSLFYGVTSGSLPSPAPALLTSGNRTAKQATLANGDQVVDRVLGSSIGGDGQTKWVSLLLRPQGALGDGEFNGFFGLSLIGNEGSAFIGKPGSAPAANYAVEGVGGANQSASGVAPVVDQVVLLVARIDFAAGNETISLFVNPAIGGADPTTPDAVNTALAIGAIGTLRLDGSAAYAADEIRIGDSFSVVTPVPEPVAMGLIACLAPLALRRRAR